MIESTSRFPKWFAASWFIYSGRDIGNTIISMGVALLGNIRGNERSGASRSL